MWSYRNVPRQRRPPENTEPEGRPGPGTPEEQIKKVRESETCLTATKHKNSGV